MDTRNARLLDQYTHYLLASFGQATATGLAALLPHLSHDQVTRFLSQQELTDKDLWKIVKPHLRHVQCEGAVLILDDTGEEKPRRRCCRSAPVPPAGEGAFQIQGVSRGQSTQSTMRP
jgi:hypothetical protein